MIDLQYPVFAHGQLYTAFSRVRKRDDMRVLISPGTVDACDKIPNVVYPELLLTDEVDEN